MLSLLFTNLITCLAASTTGEYMYNETEARILSSLSAGAYSATPTACINRILPGDWLLHLRIEIACDEGSNRCAAYIARSDKQKRFIIVFRGTKTKKQLLYEVKKSLGKKGEFYGAGRANLYFSNALSKLWPEIEPVLYDRTFKDYSLTLTGHSLGGALASLAALKIALNGFRSSDDLKVVTFGEPRVGDFDLARSYDDLVPNSFRVVHGNDIVPHLPPCEKNSSFVVGGRKACSIDPKNVDFHHATEVWYPDGMEPGDKYILCKGPPVGEDMNCSNKLPFEWSKKFQYIRDHIYYFGYKLPAYGKEGCVGSKETKLKGAESENSESLSVFLRIAGGWEKLKRWLFH